MCVFSSVASGVASVVSTVSSVVIGLKQAADYSSIQKYQAEQNIVQAKIAERNAVYERQEGIEDAREKRLNAIKNIGTKMAVTASGNIMTSSETALNIFDDEKLSGEIDALKQIDSSEKRAQSYMDSAQYYYANAALKTYQSNNTIKNGLMYQSFNLGGNLTKLYDGG